ncbi:type IV secretory system conjugative DNA transfer family protein [Leuconostocaceae bacterium ESL0958]|nr:type IV secretory system conjugative DNA transfer family protein [Leuconostocaceae bacterium ESL0958]
MQTYQKKIKPHLLLGGVLAVFFYWLINFLIGLPGQTFTEKEMALFNFNETVQNHLHHWYQYFGISLWAFLGAWFGFMLALLLYTYHNDRGVYRNGEEHGSARYATQKELDHFADHQPENNILLSKNGRMGLFNRLIPRPYQRNKNCVVIGGSGSGKTFTFLKPNLMQMNASFIVTDPKGLLVHETGQMLKNNGYQIKVFDLARLTDTDRFNVFNYMPTELDVDRVLESISIAIQDSDKKKDFWQLASDLLLRSLIAFLWYDGQEKNYTPNIAEVADLLRGLEREDDNRPSLTEKLFDALEKKRPGNYASKQFQLFQATAGAPETQAGVIGNAVAIFSVFDHQVVTDMITDDTMDIETWNEDKTAVFLHIPEMNAAYNFLASMLIATSITILSKKADDVNQGFLTTKNDQPLRHVRYYLDEFANIGRLPNIDKALATLRSREMSVVIILQALDQLKTMYQKGWASLLATADTLIFLGGNEKETIEFLSQRAGKQTISIRNHSINNGRGGSENRQTQARDLLTPDEVGRLDNRKALVFINGQNVFMDDKYNTFDHPRSAELANNPSEANWYRYKRFKNPYEEMQYLAVNDPTLQVEDCGLIEGTLDVTESLS